MFEIPCGVAGQRRTSAVAARGLTIAVDGVIGAGKTTTARAVAQALGYRHIDTGAFYRAVTLAAMRAGIRPGDEAVERLPS